jgi:hypothetical protein
MSALLVGAGSRNSVRKSGPIAPPMIAVSARLKLPCMPRPRSSSVSATSTPQVSGCAQPVEKDRKLTTIEGIGVTAEPFKSMAEIGSVPGMAPRSSETKRPLT